MRHKPTNNTAEARRSTSCAAGAAAGVAVGLAFPQFSSVQCLGGPLGSASKWFGVKLTTFNAATASGRAAAAAASTLLSLSISCCSISISLHKPCSTGDTG